jgi:hypothetical protein
VNARLLVKTLEEGDAGSFRRGAAQRHQRFRIRRQPDNTVSVQQIQIATSNDKDTAVTGNESGRQCGNQRIRPSGKRRPGDGRGPAAIRARAARRAHAPQMRINAMNPSRPFILRPVATALLMAAMFLAGGVAYFAASGFGASRSGLSHHPGAHVLSRREPDVVASAVTAPLERQFGEVAGLSQMTSTSAGGVSVIVMQFQLSLNIDVAEQEVQAAINAAQSYLPANLPTPPVYSKSNPADAPVLTLALTSNEMALSQVEDLADTRLAPKISQIPASAW